MSSFQLGVRRPGSQRPWPQRSAGDLVREIEQVWRPATESDPSVAVVEARWSCSEVGAVVLRGTVLLTFSAELKCADIMATTRARRLCKYIYKYIYVYVYIYICIYRYNESL